MVNLPRVLRSSVIFVKRTFTAFMLSGLCVSTIHAQGEVVERQVQGLVDLAFLLADEAPYAGALPQFLSSGGVHEGGPGSLSDLREAGGGEPIVVEAFDNLFYIGFASVGSWVYDTGNGLIVFDTLNNPEEAETVLVPAMRELGLDPADIKYVVIMHGHGDHYGGARYLQDTYDSLILAGPRDWGLMQTAYENPREGREPLVPPVKGDLGRDVVDGEVLSVGDKSVTLYLTPGHTLDTVSTIFPVTYRGLPHVVAFWGGNGMPSNLYENDRNAGLLTYRDSLLRFTQIGQKRGADAIISNHPVVDGTFRYAKYVQSGDELGLVSADSPWVVGRDRFVRIMASQIIGLDAGIVKQLRE